MSQTFNIVQLIEETLHEVIDEESNELRLQLQMKDEALQMKEETIKKLQRETQVV